MHYYDSFQVCVLCIMSPSCALMEVGTVNTYLLSFIRCVVQQHDDSWWIYSVEGRLYTKLFEKRLALKYKTSALLFSKCFILD